MICKPDAVYLNLEKKILSFLRQKGLKILACKYVTITPSLCRRLYWDEDDDSDYWWWKLETEYFNLGESLCILVQGTPQYPYRSISELIVEELKGDNKPEFAETGTIRHTFGARNRLFNLFHSSDCAKEARREASLFFTAENLERLRYENTPCLLKQKEDRFLDIPDTYFRIKLHCIQISSLNPKVKQKYINYIEEKKRQSKSVRDAKKQIWLYETLQEEYRLFYEDIHESKLLVAITNYEYFKKIDYDVLYQMFNKKGLKLTKWEFCLLKTTMLIPPKKFRA